MTSDNNCDDWNDDNHDNWSIPHATVTCGSYISQLYLYFTVSNWVTNSKISNHTHPVVAFTDGGLPSLMSISDTLSTHYRKTFPGAPCKPLSLDSRQ